MNYTIISTTLQKLREDRGYTQEELAAFFGAGKELIEDWESGLSEPTISECMVLSKLYGIPLDDMFAGFDETAMIPQESQTAFEQAVRLNRMTNRWCD